MDKASLRKAHKEAQDKYLAMVGNPPADYAYLGPDTVIWRKDCDEQHRAMCQFERAIKLIEREARNAPATARRKR
ncbi:MAG: hypothetical protein K2P94_00835 [Rhodospirillaceae bacterium]|nr:hypothetical protein [Rhodospirillaceae bacterium]